MMLLYYFFAFFHCTILLSDGLHTGFDITRVLNSEGKLSAENSGTAVTNTRLQTFGVKLDRVHNNKQPIDSPGKHDSN